MYLIVLTSKFEYFYSINENRKINIDEINFLRDEKISVFVMSNDLSLIRKFVDLPMINVNGKDFSRIGSFINVENNIDKVRGKLILAKKNNFTTILVSIDRNMYNIDSLVKENGLVDYYVYVKK